MVRVASFQKGFHMKNTDGYIFEWWADYLFIFTESNYQEFSFVFSKV